MLRRDYILRIVEQFVQMLTQVRSQIETREFAKAACDLDKAFQELAGAGPEAVAKLSETELLARLMVDASSLVVRDKMYLLVAMLQEAGRLRASEQRTAESRACLLKALNLLVTLQMQGTDFELAQFIPTIDSLREQLADAPLPAQTLAALWRHYERIGAYARAEDALFELLEVEPGNDALLAEAKLFYQRLLNKSDAALEEGNLPRAEVTSGLAEISER